MWRIRQVILGVGLGLGCLIGMSPAEEAVITPSGGAVTVKVPPPPIVVVFVADMPEHTESPWFKALQEGGLIRAKLGEHVKEWRMVVMPRRPDFSAWGRGGSLYSAAMYGVRCLPTMVLLDSKGRVIELSEGGADVLSLNDYADELLKKVTDKRPLNEVNDIPRAATPEQEAEAICRAMMKVPPVAWNRDYPATVRRLRRLDGDHPALKAADEAWLQWQEACVTAALIEKSIHANDEQNIRECLAAWQKRCDDESRAKDMRQYELLTMVHPLWVRLEALYYRQSGAHCGKSEEAFNKAVETLEYARDLDNASDYGRHAHGLREELRKARLQAKKYD